jgi:hypothetical protein
MARLPGAERKLCAGGEQHSCRFTNTRRIEQIEKVRIQWAQFLRAISQAPQVLRYGEGKQPIQRERSNADNVSEPYKPPCGSVPPWLLFHILPTIGDHFGQAAERSLTFGM